jgi:hypothetical protein
MRKPVVVLTILALALSLLGSAPATAKKKKKKACPAFVGTAEAAEAELVKVTDAATEEAPIETTVEVPAGTPAAAGHAYLNVQADPKAKETGLYVRFEFPSYEDNDLYLLNPDGEEAASAAGFNQTPFGPFDGTGSGGHSEQGAEQIDGFATADCQGYTADFASYMSFGGEMTVKVWLGEVAPEEEEG